jgi:hypothetical protein
LKEKPDAFELVNGVNLDSSSIAEYEGGVFDDLNEPDFIGEFD